MGQNPQGVSEHDRLLTGLFDLWITSVPPTDREKIWSGFSQFVSSNDLCNILVKSLQRIRYSGNPNTSILHHLHLLHSTMDNNISSKSQQHIASGCSEASHLSPDEENALWDVAGYVIRKVMKSLRSGQNATREAGQIVIALSFLEDAEELNDNDDEQGDETLSTACFNAINRGGQFKCTNDFYKFMRVLELKGKCHGNGHIDQVSDTPIRKWNSLNSLRSHNYKNRRALGAS